MTGLSPSIGRTPITVLTGFLGAGKTTLLRRHLSEEAFGDTAVLVNEFGEIGLDHLLVDAIAPDIVLLDSGCICCRIRGELKAAIVDLLDRRARAEIPPFRRIVIETTGLAEPGPLVSTLVMDPLLANHTALAGIVTVVDAVNAVATHARRPEWLAQVAAADRIVIAKADLADDSTLDALRALLEEVAPGADVTDSTAAGAVDLTKEEGPCRNAFDLDKREAAPRHQHTADPHHGVRSVALTFDRPLDWAAFGVWFSGLLHFHGDHILRAKGLIDIGNGRPPVVLNGVQHTIHPPEHLEAWPDADQRTRLVLILEGIEPNVIVRSLRAYLSIPMEVTEPDHAHAV